MYPSFTTDPFSSAFLSADVTDDVAAWLANPADNPGWAFILETNSFDSDSWGFVTSMDDKPAEHPKLVVVAEADHFFARQLAEVGAAIKDRTR